MGKVFSYFRSAWFTTFSQEHKSIPKSHPNKLVIPWNFETKEFKFNEADFLQLDNPFDLTVQTVCNSILKVT
jgi:hypothetical protein